MKNCLIASAGKHLHEHKVVRLVVKEDMHSEFVEKFLVKKTKTCDYIAVKLH